MPVPNAAGLYAQRREALRGVGQSFALSLFLVYLFVIFSRIVDFVLVGYHIPAMLFLAAVPAAFITGAWSNLTLKGPMKWVLAFSLWFAIAVPFSVWKGGSAQQLRGLLITLLTFVPLLGLPASFRDIRRIHFVIGIAVCVFAAFALATGQFEGGRIALEGESTFANANDLAQVLLLGLPFALYALYEVRRQPIVLGIGLLGVAPVLVALAHTGSRSLLVAAVAMFVVAFFRGSLATRVQMMVLAGIVVVAGFVFLPQSVRLRYLTFFEAAKVHGVSVSDYEAQLSAIESTLSRQELFKDSIEYTLKHPVFGVGPGMFAVARGGDAEKRNETGLWKVTHNAYTQVSSECGIPAVIFYMLMLGSTLLLIRRADRYHKGLNNPISASIRAASFTLFVAMVSFVVFAMFLSIAYQQQMLTLVALSVALERVSRQELERLKQGTRDQGPAKTNVPQKFAYSMLPR